MERRAEEAMRSRTLWTETKVYESCEIRQTVRGAKECESANLRKICVKVKRAGEEQ